MRVHVRSWDSAAELLVTFAAWTAHCGKMPDEPIFRQAGDFFQRFGLLEKVRGARNDDQLFGATQQTKSLLVEFDHDVIVAADDQEGRRPNDRQFIPCQVGPTATRYNAPTAAGWRAAATRAAPAPVLAPK